MKLPSALSSLSLFLLLLPSAAAGQAVPLDLEGVGPGRGGWNAFFDYPPSHPDGTHHVQGVFRLRGAEVRTFGDRVGQCE